MGRVNYQLATFLDDGAEFVTRLSANPQLIVMRIEQRHDSLVFSIGVADVNAAADFRCASKGFAYVAGKKRVGHEFTVVSGNNRIQCNDPRGNQIGGGDRKSTRRN